MKTTPPNPIDSMKLRRDAENLLEGDAPNAAVAARLIQLTAASNLSRDAWGFEGQRAHVADLVKCSIANDERKTAVLVQANSILKAAAKISLDHNDILTTAAAGRPERLPPTPSPEAACAFLSEFMAAGAKAGQRGAHDDWFVNLGPGSGKTFFETPSAAAIEARATELATKKGVSVADKHRLAAADQLAKENKVGFGEGGMAAGRLFGLPYEKLEQVGGFALQKANANNAESVEAGALGLLAHLSGRDVQINQTLSSAEYRSALGGRLGALDALRVQLESPEGKSWSELPSEEREATLSFFRGVLGEIAALRLGRSSYGELSPVVANALSTTHDVYVHMRSDWLFDDAWGKAQAVPFDQLDQATKDADIPPFLFALNGMVEAAERSIRDAESPGTTVKAAAPGRGPELRP